MTGDHVLVISHRIKLDTPTDQHNRFIEYSFADRNISPDNTEDTRCLKTIQCLSKNES